MCTHVVFGMGGQRKAGTRYPVLGPTEVHVYNALGMSITP